MKCYVLIMIMMFWKTLNLIYSIIGKQFVE